MAPRLLTAFQRRQIQQIVRDGHLAFIAEMFGPTSISRDDFDRLRAAGKIRDEKLLPQDVAVAAHALGVTSANEQGAHGTAGGHVLTETEREAVELFRDRMAQYALGLGDQLDAAIGHVLLDVDQKRRRRRLTADRDARNEDRAAAAEVSHRIYDAAKDLRSAWLRTTHTELHNATEESKAIVLAQHHPDRDPRVFLEVRKDGCSFCKLLYLRPDGVTPRVFKLSQLLANGSNVGRKANRPTLKGKNATEWKPVVGAAHPFCMCRLRHLSEGMGFNAQGEMVYVGVKKSTDVHVELLDRAVANHVCEE